jgi:hypothetical protein
MRRQTKLTSTTIIMFVLSAAGAAFAQSAPPRVAAANNAALARLQQETSWVGPELKAARANLGATGSPVDLNSLADRKAAGGAALTLPSGAGEPMPSNTGGSDNLQAVRGDATGATATAAGSTYRVDLPADQQGGAVAAGAPQLPETVIRGQINPAAKGCYESDPAAKAKKPGRLSILIKLNAAGEVDAVTVANNVGLSPFVASCITAAAHAATFAAPGANGATIRAAFAFPAQEDPAPAAAPHAKVAVAAPARPAREALAQAEPSAH